jgi:hypothetical protein
MNETQERQFGSRIRHLLNQGTHEVQPGVARRLAQARERALERVGTEPALEWADNVTGDGIGWAGLAVRVLVPVAMLLASAGAVYTWQQNQRAAEIEEVDALLLTDDLPIDAYLDRGFQTWLRKRTSTSNSQEE